MKNHLSPSKNQNNISVWKNPWKYISIVRRYFYCIFTTHVTSICEKKNQQKYGLFICTTNVFKMFHNFVNWLMLLWEKMQRLFLRNPITTFLCYSITWDQYNFRYLRIFSFVFSVFIDKYTSSANMFNKPH